MIIDKEFFEPKDTFECGQCFRWNLVDEAYVGVVGQALLEVVPAGPGAYEVRVVAGRISAEDLAHYFDEEAPYDKITRSLTLRDKWLEEAVAFGKGIRLLNQDPFETLMTFIISANNNIPKIKMAVEALSLKFGKFIATYKGLDYYTFPKLEDLAGVSWEALSVKGMGYRAKSMEKAVKQLVEGNFDFNLPFTLPYEEAQALLKELYGVGNKVADCVLLFAYGHKNAFPVDTWMRKVLEDLYGVEGPQAMKELFAKRYFSEFGGYAQQYLFYYMRSKR